MLKKKILNQYLDGNLDYNKIKNRIKLAVYGPDYSSATDMVSYSPVERINLVTVVDFKKQVINYRKLVSETIDNSEILENALIQTFEDDIKYIGTKQNVSNGEVSIDFISFAGESHFLSTLLFNPIFIKEFKGEKGYIFGIPSRKNFLLIPINNTEKLPSKLIIFAYYVFELYKNATKPLLPDLFYCNNGNINNIFKYDSDKPNGIIIPEELRNN